MRCAGFSAPFGRKLREFAFAGSGHEGACAARLLPLVWEEGQRIRLRRVGHEPARAARLLPLARRLALRIHHAVLGVDGRACRDDGRAFHAACVDPDRWRAWRQAGGLNGQAVKVAASRRARLLLLVRDRIERTVLSHRNKQ